MGNVLYTGLCACSLLASLVLGQIAPLSNGTSPYLTRLPAFEQKPRVFILSDILNEVDDSQSLVRYLLYSNEFDTQGICATTSEWLPNATYPDAMKEIIDAYGSVVDNLNQHVNTNAQYKNASVLTSLVTSGPTVYGKAALTQAPSEGALKIVESLQASTEPLWVISWGGINTLAQALQHISTTLPAAEATTLISRLRIYAISDQDDTGPWLRTTYPDLFYIVSLHAWNSYGNAAWAGISMSITGSNASTIAPAWITSHIQRGPLGAQYPLPLYIMEGDSPSFLYLIQNGLGSPEHPDWGSWGGRYGYAVPGSSQYHDTVDAVVGVDGGAYATNQAGVWRWREHFQNDFAARMQWTLTPDFANASHPPVPVVNGTTGPAFLNITLGEEKSVVLDASDSYNSDDGALEFQWYQYREPSAYATSAASLPVLGLRGLEELPGAAANGTMLAYNEAGFEDVVFGSKVEVTVPEAAAGGVVYHVILQVTGGTVDLPLRRYLRVLINT